ncbi:MAG: ABC transporter substrate-binding protein [Gammaproteobacteria bacterium]
MTPIVTLSGIGWDHPRCMAPLLASAASYEDIATPMRIEWAARSLKEFGDGNLAALAREYDLLVFDHPYVGAAHAGGWLLDWTSLLTAGELQGLQADSLGPCYTSYEASGGLWGLPLDAAAQVASSRDDLLERLGTAAPVTAAELRALAIAARRNDMYIALPSVPIDAICTFLTLCANLGEPLQREAGHLPPPATVRSVLTLQRELLELSHPLSRQWNPIGCYEHMISHDDVCYVPFGFGYTNYSRVPSARRLTFRDIPAFGNVGCAGAILGGAGIAISAGCAHVPEAVRYAMYLTSGKYQSHEYCASGGQPASLAAWSAPQCDTMTGGFLSGTRQTMQRAYLRPTFDGFVPYFKAAGDRIAAFLGDEASLEATAKWLETAYAK